MTNFLSKWWHSMDVDLQPLMNLFDSQIKIDEIIVKEIDTLIDRVNALEKKVGK